jgi:integrase
MALNTDKHLIRVTAVAHILAIAEQAVIALGEQGELDLVEQGGERYVTTSSLRTYIKRKNRRARRAAPKGRANHEGSVYDSPRGSGIWYAAISVREGRKRRRVKRRASSQQEALQKLEELRRTYREGRALQPGPVEPAEGTAEESTALPTYGELFEEWRAAIETSVKRSTLRHYDTAINQWLRPHLGERPISVSDYRFLQQLFNEQLSPRYAPSTVHRAYGVLRQALDYAVEPARYIASNPAARLRLPKLKTLSPSIALSIDELVAVLRLARGHRYGAAIFFAALTGARLGECLGIQQGDVDEQRNTIHIQRQLTTLRGEGVVEETLKTAGSDRLLPRTPRLAELLERTVAERRVALQYLGYREAPGSWFFLNTEGRLLSPRLVERAFDELVEQAGLAEVYPARERPGREQDEGGEGQKSGGRRKRCEVSFHDLRSTLLTQLGDLGVDETTRGRIAGHGPKNVTQRYDRSTAERMRAALTAFEEMVFAALEKGEEGR